jgi:hypothetical protein
MLINQKEGREKKKAFQLRVQCHDDLAKMSGSSSSLFSLIFDLGILLLILPTQM